MWITYAKLVRTVEELEDVEENDNKKIKVNHSAVDVLNSNTTIQRTPPLGYVPIPPLSLTSHTNNPTREIFPINSGNILSNSTPNNLAMILNQYNNINNIFPVPPNINSNLPIVSNSVVNNLDRVINQYSIINNNNNNNTSR